MKIGFDIRTLMDAKYSGVSEYTLNLVKALLDNDQKNEYVLFYNSYCDVSSRLPSFNQKNVRVEKKSYPNKVFNYLLQKGLNWPKVDRLLKVDLFFMPHLNFISLSGQAKSVITVHDLSFLRYPEFFSWRKNFWHRMLGIRRLLHKFDRIVAVSESTKADVIDLCSIPPEKITVIRSAINPMFVNSRIESDRAIKIREKYKLPKQYLLYLGTIEPRKNIEGLIGAYDIFRSNNQGSSINKLVLAGGWGWKSGSVKSAWRNSNYRNDIIFLDYIDADDRPYIYRSASLFIYPSFYEGFGFPPLEAMSCGVPVITSASSSLPETVGRGALLVDPYNITDIANAMAEVLNNNNLRLNLKNQGLIQAERFNWQNTAQKYLELFGGLC